MPTPCHEFSCHKKTRRVVPSPYFYLEHVPVGFKLMRQPCRKHPLHVDCLHSACVREVCSNLPFGYVDTLINGSVIPCECCLTFAANLSDAICA